MKRSVLFVGHLSLLAAPVGARETAEGSFDAAVSTGAVAEEGGPYGYAGARATRGPDFYDSEARFGALPYLQRYKPARNLWEVGFFGGAFAPAFDHNLHLESTAHEAYRAASFSAGGRLAFFPLPFLGVEAEGMVSPSATRDSNRSALLYALRGHGILQLPLWSVVPFALVGGGVLGAVSQPMGHDGDPLFHFGVGVKVPFSSVVSARLDLRDNLTQANAAPQGSLSHSFEVLLGATFTFDRKPPPLVDSDYDGLFDSEDECPQEGALSRDGCAKPHEAAKTCDDCVAPQVPVPAECPVLDQDGDGILDSVDQCPTEAETRNGFEDDDGCPDEIPEAVKKFSGVVPGISFEVGQARIRKESYPTLDQAYAVLVEHPSIKLEVSGHTSSEGKPSINKKLSEDRAAAVRDYLVKKGIDEARIVARGAGPDEPVADNATREGRDQNRRIEFRVLSQP